MILLTGSSSRTAIFPSTSPVKLASGQKVMAVTSAARMVPLWFCADERCSGPEFLTYFEEQNAKIDKGEIKAEKLVISVLGINNVRKVLRPPFFR